MIMKKLIIISTFLISGNAFCSNIDTIQAESKITDVTIFFSGAQVTRHSDLKLSKGKHLIMVDKLPKEINAQSIQVNGVNNCKILSVKHQLNYQNENKKGNDQSVIEDKIKEQELKIKEIRNKINVFEMEEKLLIDNSILKKYDGAVIKDIKDAADFYRARLNEIKQGKLDLSVELDAANKKIQELYTQLNEVTAQERKTYSQILITLDCEKEAPADMSMSYFISSAGWSPLYDFRVDDITRPLVIVYNANVYQSSGEDWNNVNIKLSTGDPSLSGNKPELITWYLDKENPYLKESARKGPSVLQGRVLDKEKNEALPFASVMVYSGNEVIASVNTDINGQYIIKPMPSGNYTVKVAYIGYEPVQMNSVQLSPDKITFQDFNLQASTIQLAEAEIVSYQYPLIDKDYTTVQTTISSENISRMAGRDAGVYADAVGCYNLRGGRSEEETVYVDGLRMSASGNIPSSSTGGTKSKGIETLNYISNSLKSTVTNLEYVIEIPYTIPSDGKDYSIKIKEASVPVNYVYNAVPKLDCDAFLTAEIIDWTQLNLLSGKTSIYYQGTFTGESFIDANQTGDTLNVSLGRDRNIIVKRESNKETIDKRMIGSSIKETIGWDITIRNNKNAKIKITVEDQYPVSEKRSIEIEQLESSNAKIDDKTGKLKWESEIEPNDKKVFTYKYSVKYPRYADITIE